MSDGIFFLGCVRVKDKATRRTYYQAQVSLGINQPRRMLKRKFRKAVQAAIYGYLFVERMNQRIVGIS